METQYLHGVRVASRSPMVSHLFFADDSIIFVKANWDEARAVMAILDVYEQASGQMLNLDKTTVSFSKGVHETVRSQITSILRVQEIDAQDRYLGLPTVVGRSKKRVADTARDKLWKKLQG
ncbi:hypothetical protein RND81_09G036900 [Saponaria officinalis]|uniref:Reverse transcriptase domain-containing protein n=1 Tax=Saponaria officinalis TaxID=3572 RepID=A0AAW1IH25_SAPOF